jgi:hypothetical protein
MRSSRTRSRRPRRQVRLDRRRTGAIPGRQTLGAAPAQRDLARQVAALGRQQAVLHRRHAIAAGGRVKAADQLARLAVSVADGLAEGVLELVAIAPLRDGRDDLAQLEAVEMADPAQRLIDLLLLDLELALVREHLPGDAGVRGERLDPLGARLEHLEGARVRVAALALVHDGAHAIAGNRAGDEHDVAAVADSRDALAAERQRFDLQLELVASLRSRELLRSARRVRLRCAGRGVHGASVASSSSSAFCA